MHKTSPSSGGLSGADHRIYARMLMSRRSNISEVERTLCRTTHRWPLLRGG